MAKSQKNKKIKTKKHLAREQREKKQIKILIVIAVVVAVFILGFILYGVISQMVIRPKQTIAEVNDTVITVHDLDSRVEYTRVQMLTQAYNYYEMYQVYSMYSADYGEAYLTYAQNYVSQLIQPISLGSDVLDEMINEIIIREEAAARGITVSDEEVEEAIRNAFGFYPEGTYTPTVTATILSTPTYSQTELSLVTLTSTPSATLTPTETPSVTATPTEDPADAEAETSAEQSEAEEDSSEDAGSSEETPTPELSSTITTTPTVTSTPTTYTTEIYAEDIEEFDDYYGDYNFSIEEYRYIFETQLLKDQMIELITQDLIPIQEEVWARHILVETEEEAEDIYNQLEDGADFHELAAEFSTDSSNSEAGGDLGWFDDETMVTEFTEAVFSLEIGEISEPVATSYGYHIIQVLGKREAQTPVDDFEEDKEEAFAEWLSEVRSTEYEVTLYDNWEDYVSDYPEVSSSFLSAVFQLSE